MHRAAIFTLFLLVPLAHADVATDIKAVVKQGDGADKRAAWERLSKSNPDAVPQLLGAMDTQDIVIANWLRTAIDRIVERDNKNINADAVIAFVRDSKHAGRARRYALEIVETLRPGTSRQLAAGWLADPEFRYEAIDAALEDAQQLAKKDGKAALPAFRHVFEASRDVMQARAAAKGLLDLGETVSVAQHLGFLTEWYVVGPFDGMNERSFQFAYPPAKHVDLTAEYEGKGGEKIRWKPLHVREAAPASRDKHQVLVDLGARDVFGNVDDAAAFAYTEILMPKAQTVEFRGAADDNMTVWVNGKREFGFEEWRNGVRLDRHRFKVALREGKNAILVKVCQSLPYIAFNWEFMLRIVDETEKGVAFKSGLPAEK